MGGPERQTTPRTGLDDFVAGLLKYGTLGYLPPDVLNQLLAPVPGTPGGGGQPGEGGGGQPDIGNPDWHFNPMLAGGTPGGGLPGLQASAAAPGGIGLGGQPNAPIPSGAVPFDIGQFLQGRLSVPQYGGLFTAPTNQLQTNAAGGAGSALAAFFGQSPTQTGGRSGYPGLPNIPPGPLPPGMSLAALASGGGGGGYPPAVGGGGTPAGIGTGNDIISALLGRGQQGGGSIERSLLGILGAQGPQANLAQAFAALDAQRRTGLAQDTRDLREQFSFGGNRFSSDLANAIGARQSTSEQNFLAQAAPLAAQLAPQLFSAQTQALGTAGQLGLGSNQQSLEALLGLPQAFSTTSMLPGQVAGQGFNLGEQLRQIMQGDVAGRQAEFTRTQGALFPTLLQYAAGAPQIYTPGIGQQLLGAGTTLGASALGAK